MSGTRSLRRSSRKAGEQVDRLLEDIVQNSSIVVWEIDADGVFTYSDGRGLSHLGLQPGEVVGVNFFDLYSEEAEIIAMVRRVLSGETIEREIQLSNLLIDSWARPLCDDGNIIGARGIATIITSEQQQQPRVDMLEQQFQRVFQLSPATLTIQSMPDGVILDVNQSYEEVTGWKREEVLGRTSRELNLYVEPEGRSELFEKLSRDREVRNLEMPFRRRDGEIRWAVASVGLFEADGETRLLSVGIDITELHNVREEQRKLKDELLRQEQLQRERAEQYSREFVARWQSVTRCTPDYILLVNKEGIITSINRTNPPLTPADVIGKPVSAFVPPEGREAAERDIEQVLRTGEPCIREAPALRADGSDAWFLSRTAPVRQDDGEITGVIVVATDITEQKEARERDQRQQEELSRLNRICLADAVAGKILHELKNWMGSLNFQAGASLRTAEKYAAQIPDKVLAAIHRTSESTNKVRLQVIEMLDFLRSKELRKVSVPAGQPMGDAVQFMEATAHENGIQLSVSPEHTAVVVECDPMHIMQVLINLQWNAINVLRKQPEKHPRWIRLSVRLMDDGQIEFLVSDSGPGLPDGFDLNECRLRTHSDEYSSGLGLGLEICRYVAEAHGGILVFGSVAEGGAVVGIRIPLRHEEGERNDDRSD